MSSNNDLSQLKIIVKRLGREARADEKKLRLEGHEEYSRQHRGKSHAYANVVAKITLLERAKKA